MIDELDDVPPCTVDSGSCLCTRRETCKVPDWEHDLLDEDEDGVATMIDPHPWEEFNAYGNTCHHPGCSLAEEGHAEFQERLAGIIAVDARRMSEDDARQFRDAFAARIGAAPAAYPIEPYEIAAPVRPRWRWWHRFRRTGWDESD
jgi:hypothetical protein